MEENPVHDEGPSDDNADENGEIEDHLTQRLHNYVQRKKTNASNEIVTDDTGKHRGSRSHKPASPRSVPDVGTASGLKKADLSLMMKMMGSSQLPVQNHRWGYQNRRPFPLPHPPPAPIQRVELGLKFEREDFLFLNQDRQPEKVLHLPLCQ